MLRLAVLLGAGFLLWKFFERFSPRQNTLWVLGLTGLFGILNLQWGGIENPDSLMWWMLSRGQTDDPGWILYRPKLYAWFLRLIPEYTWVPAAHLLLRLLTVGVFLSLASSFKWPKPLAPLLALFLGINSLWLQEQNQILDTTLFTLLCLLVLAIFLKAWKQPSPVNLLLFGLSAGLCTLTRQLMDPFLFVGFALLIRRSGFWRPRFGKPSWNSRRPGLSPPASQLSGQPHASWKSVTGSIAVFVLVGWMGLWIHWIQFGIPKRTVALGVNLFTHSSYYKWENPSEGEKQLIRELLSEKLIREKLIRKNLLRKNLLREKLIHEKPMHQKLIRENPIRESTSKDTDAKRWNTHYTHNISWFANALPHIYQRHLENKGLTRLQTDKLLRGKYFRWVRQQPGRFLYSWWNEGRRFLFKTEEYAPFSQLSRWMPLPPWLERLEKYMYHIPLWLLMLCGLAGLFITASKSGVVRRLTAGASSAAAQRPSASAQSVGAPIPMVAAHTREATARIPPMAALATGLVPLGYLAMIASIHMGFTRYTLPMLPFLYISAGFFLSTVLTAKGMESPANE